MKWVIRIALLIAIAAILIYFYPQDPGEVYVRLPFFIPPFKTSPLVFVLGLIIIVFLIFSIFKLLVWVLSLPWSVSKSVVEFNSRRNSEKLQTGWLWFTAGGHIEALRIAKKTYKGSKLKNESALLATLSNLMLDKIVPAEEWLAKVDKPKDREILLNNITKVKLHLSKNEADQALKAIAEVEKANGFNSIVGRMKLNAYKIQGNWQELLKVATTLYKKEMLATKEYLEWVSQARLGEIGQMDANASSDPYKWWRKISADHKFNQVILENLVNLLIQRKDYKDASEVIEKTIEYSLKNRLELPSKLVGKYDQTIDQTEIEKAIKKCSKWLKTEKDNPALLRLMGSLSEKASMWGNAISYYEASIGFEDKRSALKALVRLYEKTEQNDKAENIRSRLLDQYEKQKLEHKKPYADVENLDFDREKVELNQEKLLIEEEAKDK